MGFNPFSHERLALDAAKSIEHAMHEAPLRDFRLTRRAQRVQTRYERGATVRLPAQFHPDGAAHPIRGRLGLKQSTAQPAWTSSRLRVGEPRPVTVLPGEPTAARWQRRRGKGDGAAWRVRIGDQSGALVLPMEFAAAFGPHLTQRG